jgi:N-acetylmuramoyl-L-alanine amidase
MGGLTHPSPSFDRRPAGAAVDMLVIHYTGMASGDEALARLCDPAARVSAHYLVHEDGRICSLVAEPMRAWHAGLSAWAGRSGLNDVSIGIELVNPGHEWGYRAFPAAQMAALADLARGIVERWRVSPSRVVAHADIAPHRKEDPGELFDWRGLAAAGVGLWTDDAEPAPIDPRLARAALASIGYEIGQPGVTFIQLLTAFQRRFRQARVDGALDGGTMGRILAVSALYRHGGMGK